MDLLKVFIFNRDFRYLVHEFIFEAEKCQNEQCIFFACCVLQKIEDMYVPTIELLIHC